MFWRRRKNIDLKYRINDASNDVNHPPLSLTPISHLYLSPLSLTSISPSLVMNRSSIFGIGRECRKNLNIWIRGNNSGSNTSCASLSSSYIPTNLIRVTCESTPSWQGHVVTKVNQRRWLSSIRPSSIVIFIILLKLSSWSLGEHPTHGGPRRHLRCARRVPGCQLGSHKVAFY